LWRLDFRALESGDLFIWPDDGGGIAIVVTDPTSDGEKLALLLGPSREQGAHRPALKLGPSSHALVISFGKDFLVRLPCEAGGWLSNEPPVDAVCLLLQGDKLYFRGFFDGYGSVSRSLYVSVEDGTIFTVRSGSPQGGFSHPGRAMYAIEWALWTTEKNRPNPIVSFPSE